MSLNEDVSLTNKVFLSLLILRDPFQTRISNQDFKGISFFADLALTPARQRRRTTGTNMEMSKLAPAFAKLAEAAQEISEIFAAAGGVTLGKRGPGALLLDADGKPIKKKKEKRAPRAPTKFNEFMRTNLAQVKSDNPDKSPKEHFALCAMRWATAPENPKSSAAAALPPAKSEKGSLKSGKGKSKK